MGSFPDMGVKAVPVDFTTVHLARRATGRGPRGDIINNRTASRLAYVARAIIREPKRANQQRGVALRAHRRAR